MAISVYAGLMGSGKSYEVVKSVIVPALANGRRVVSNISGLNIGEIAKYIQEKHGASTAPIGELVVVKNEQVIEPTFFPDESKPDAPSVVHGGDLVAIDEVWQFWGVGQKIGANAMQFFRMHRHYTHPTTQVACDLVLMIQDLATLHRSIRAVVEMTYVMTKLKSLGLNSRYRVELYEGHKIRKSSRYDYYVNSYDKRIFPLYQSYTGGAGKERRTDRRQNVLANKRLWFVVGGMVVASLLAWHFISAFFRGRAVHKDKTTPAAQLSQSPAVNAGATQAAPPLSKQYRVAGTYSIGGDAWVVIADGDGRIRLASPSSFSGRGLTTMGIIDGERVGTFTGSVHTASPADKKDGAN